MRNQALRIGNNNFCSKLNLVTSEQATNVNRRKNTREIIVEVASYKKATTFIGDVNKNSEPGVKKKGFKRKGTRGYTVLSKNKQTQIST